MMHVIQTTFEFRRVRVQFDNQKSAMKLGTKLLIAGFTVEYYVSRETISLSKREVVDGVRLIKY